MGKQSYFTPDDPPHRLTDTANEAAGVSPVTEDAKKEPIIVFRPPLSTEEYFRRTGGDLPAALFFHRS
jgi:hypothetical protein